MTTFQHWLIFVACVVIAVLTGAGVLVLTGRGDLARVTINLAIVLSAIGLAFAALMAGIIVWCRVRGGTRGWEPRSPRSAHRVSSRSKQREM